MFARQLNLVQSPMLGDQLLMPGRLLSPLMESLLLLLVVKHCVLVWAHQMGWFQDHLSLPSKANPS